MGKGFSPRFRSDSPDGIGTPKGQSPYGERSDGKRFESSWARYKKKIVPLEKDIFFMRIVLEEAMIAFNKGEVPVGAVLVANGEIISRAHNMKESLSDPTAHAEIIAIKEASSKLKNWRLEDATLYVTKEPCIMCAGALLNMRAFRLVFGCKDEKGGAVESLYSVLSDRRLNHQIEVTSGVLEKECRDILREFFKNLRHNSSEY
ncbi:MAG: nucleoside deaminase [Nitrospirae bacterium]|nr:nucleoside deaminase [Nitrospirota bacterium]